MGDNVAFDRLFRNVLHEDIIRKRVTKAEIRKAVYNMAMVYKPDPYSYESDTLYVADYNDVAHRCAYLHKYAPLHTALVADTLEKVVIHNVDCFKDLINENGSVNICSLGGGPGSDVIGALAVLHELFGYFQINATIVDTMYGWHHTFNTIIAELKYGEYGLLSTFVSEQYFNWTYEEANLLGKMTNEVNKAIGSANLITMIKFISAASCKDSPGMIGKIFRSMKQGALILYIDNAGGGFHQMVRNEAQACNLMTVFGPHKYQHYINHAFDTKRFGITPCLETKVSIHMWRKPHQGEAPNAYRNDNCSEGIAATGQIDIKIANDNFQPVILTPTTGWGYAELRNHNDDPRPRGPPRRSRSRSPSNQRRPVEHQPRAQVGHCANEDENDSANDDCGSCCVIS